MVTLSPGLRLVLRAVGPAAKAQARSAPNWGETGLARRPGLAKAQVQKRARLFRLQFHFEHDRPPPLDFRRLQRRESRSRLLNASGNLLAKSVSRR